MTPVLASPALRRMLSRLRLRPLCILAGIALTLAASSARSQTVAGLDYLGQAVFNTNTFFNNTQVGGLSGISYDSANNVYYSISDDRSQINPARFYTLTINLNGGQLTNSSIAFTNVTTLKDAGGNTFAFPSLDPESIITTGRGTVYVSSEGDTNNGIQPFVNEFSISTGQQVRALPIPPKFAVTSPPPATPTSGVRNNLGFETLALTSSGTLVTATENALIQDGPAASPTTGSPARILTFNDATGQSGAEYLYNTDPVAHPPIPSTNFSVNGIVDMLSLGGNRYLLLERSFAIGAAGTIGNTGYTIKLYEVSTDSATDISGINSLTSFGGTVTPATKRLLLDFDLLGIPLDNIEGLTFGPDLANGQRSLFIVADNNFAAAQFTQFLGFGVTVVPEPGTVVLALVTFVTSVGLALYRRRRFALERGAGS